MEITYLIIFTILSATTLYGLSNDPPVDKG